ncbi:hypothetical protein COCC4DRAFT_151828 [Bipolaris maydis ATCC 48331]|uniref:NADAR domain-containing protein n=2 Tax=Cochliobolus heterostrophus TaxID=5016 RepID=M2UC65_COCH5|nr:uncharacterized protein COCC4DRAFT_151828 [Bipolaris maydis ATCC 48331]EMD85588.1 hypothetical protein COCHEDRAFT_1118409 [Bipolaris maydis C5]KAJ5055535.1 hypothetical protein J3E74DRAFT_227128 [Bipolaris maydis]ENH99960.1 hypothetical protein COCC4DRAFT_151828 [Bipolaris maydis ATCC 48331]KAJ6193090.1 hypothetical protein J3E72DRAFT_407863 [Bipolaris maydis]KAJ6204171.1 hypothetical protein PSV09DRAFT_1118409 [Bipolaris maydis]
MSELSQADAPCSDEPVFFWKQGESNGYLCQWYASPFTVSDTTYATCEMYMMIQKALLFNDDETVQKMVRTTDARKHKGLGRKVQGFDQAVWDKHKFDVVVQASYYKFTIGRHAERLRGMLLATGERELIEASPFDRVWGIGFKQADAMLNREFWGENLLGKALMEVRKRLRDEEKEKEEQARLEREQWEQDLLGRVSLPANRRRDQEREASR